MRYKTKQDRINELRASICGETGIFIDLVTVIDQSSKEERPCNYTIYHGLITPYRYAKLIGVSSQAVYQRIKKGQIKTVQVQAVDGQIKVYIDLNEYPLPLK